MAIIEVNDNNLDKALAGRPYALLDFGATWCGPCQMLNPVLDQVADQRKDIAILKIDVEKNSQLATEFDVRNLPKLVVLKNKIPVAEYCGYCNIDSILDLLEQSI